MKQYGRRNSFWLIGLGLLVALVLVWGDPLLRSGVPVRAQSPPAQPTPANPPIPSPSPAQSPAPAASADSMIGGTFSDPQGRFEVGILNGFKVSKAPVGGVTLIESEDGGLAYSAIVRTRATSQKLSDSALAQIAIEAFQRGEGFQAGNFQPIIPSGVQVPWVGRLSTGSGEPLPMSGVILSRQPSQDVLLLVVAATEASKDQLPEAIANLSQTFKAL